MNPIHFLRTVLTLDALTCIAMAGLLLAADQPLAGLLNLPAALLQEAGLILLPFAGFVFWAGRHTDRLEWPVRTVAVANLLWVAASFATFAFTTPNLFGAAFVVAQALAVAAIAGLQFYGLGLFRRAYA